MTKNNKAEYTKYFTFNPASHITEIPVKAIRIEVPRSGCEITKKIGRINKTIG